MFCVFFWHLKLFNFSEVGKFSKFFSTNFFYRLFAFLSVLFSFHFFHWYWWEILGVDALDSLSCVELCRHGFGDVGFE